MAEPENKQAMETAEVSDDGEHEDIEDPDSEQAGDHGQQNELTAQLMKNPQVLAALQDRLGGIVGSPSGYIQSLPKVVKRRIKALKKLQLECTKLESKFYEEVHSLECKYAQMYQPFYDKRKDVVNAIVEPTDPECEWPSEEEHEDELADSLKNKIKLDEKKEDQQPDPKKDENTKGIPEFWLTIFKNVDLLADMVQDHDEPILKHLIDIKVRFSESPPLAFTLEFIFSPNDFFTNSVLTKHYEMKCYPDEGDPFSFEGPEIIKSSGCTIDWKKGKNVTVKVIKKKQKHKSRGAVRTVTKTVQDDSFFNFFSPPSVPEGNAEVDEELQQLINSDFEIGHFIRDRIVPRAVLYFTGEALEDDEFDEDGEEEDNVEGEEDDEENDPDYNPQNDTKAKKQPAECKQQ